MGTGRKKQIRIIKQGIADNLPESKVAPASRERPKQDPMAELICNVSEWVSEFKERGRPDPRITFQALFKEV